MSHVLFRAWPAGVPVMACPDCETASNWKVEHMKEGVK